MRSSLSLLLSVITTVVIISLTTGASASIVLFDNLLMANAQSEQLTTNQSITQQGEEKAIIQQGTVTSSPDALPGHEDQQRATILPFRPDGSMYTGVLTYTASEPVEVAILNMQTFNETEQSIVNVPEDSEFGSLLTKLDNQTSIAISYITPPYGDSPEPSASIPFAGNAIWLHTSDGTPFAASYAVSAQVLPAEMMNNISSGDSTNVTGEQGDEGGDGVDEGTAGDTPVPRLRIPQEELKKEPLGKHHKTPQMQPGGATTPDAGNKEVTVRIPQGSSELTENAYTPNPVEVNVGDTVTWINDDITPHTATSGSSSSGSTGMFGGTDDSPRDNRTRRRQAVIHVRRSWCVQVLLHTSSKHGRNCHSDRTIGYYDDIFSLSFNT